MGFPKAISNPFFFFSSRRRHTRSLRDWSSDVCSSDLVGAGRADRSAPVNGDRGSAVLVAQTQRSRAAPHVNELEELAHRDVFEASREAHALRLAGSRMPASVRSLR